MDLVEEMLACGTVEPWVGCSGTLLCGQNGAGNASALRAGGPMRLSRVVAFERRIVEAPMGLFGAAASLAVPIRCASVAIMGVIPGRMARRQSSRMCRPASVRRAWCGRP